MIVEYHRPSTVAQALGLLSRSNPPTYPLGGGSVLSRKKGEDFAVVDLQNLKLGMIQSETDQLVIGATAYIQDLTENENSPAWLRNVCRREMGRNLRQMSTIGGFLMCANGRSSLAVTLLAADVQAIILPDNTPLSFQQILAVRENVRQPWLISQVVLDTSCTVKFEFIARSPVDLPILGIATAKWPSGRMRVVVGGFGSAPRLAYDGNAEIEISRAVESVLQDSGDEWASAEYRRSVAPAVVNRLLQS
ncbi:aerobic-type carbon monoxide dehydrogenase, middle subunit CoxM/CutM homologs [Longilinea arvoryzae]|uniref:Aerobic-type carbon monoxide dehydrogenase, middle subunit CoxM/CutM homologs n=1 Tax=Longilinea arvoryzae TaxID=360412 RepID=A0A0S7BHP9_9CHLR|nr:FAD binding domain-containing protein [Longilinea arvoryzae]GAP14704.1 aerobic-type carbon monoxide dehydrogenase, middle subunit CoxM/CutM homologs [Longilinea arvoryzae]